MMSFLFLTALLLLWLFLDAQNEQYRSSKPGTHNVLLLNQVQFILKETNCFAWFGNIPRLNGHNGCPCKVFHKQNDDSFPSGKGLDCCRNRRKLFLMLKPMQWA